MTCKATSLSASQGSFSLQACCTNRAGILHENSQFAQTYVKFAQTCCRLTAAVFFDEELGLFAAEIEEEAFAGTGFDFGVGKGRRAGEGGDDEEVQQCFHGVFVGGLVFRSIQS